MIRVVALFFILLSISFAVLICVYLHRRKDGVLSIRMAWIIALSGIVLLALPVAYLNSIGKKFETINPVLCDGWAIHLYKIYEGVHTDLNTSFTELIKSNTKLIEGCTAIEYTKFSKSDVPEWLLKYNIEKYSVSYKCDLLSFNLNDIYKMKNKFYILRNSLGPCGTENIYFHEGLQPPTGYSYWYDTKTNEIERTIINGNWRDNKIFCVDLAQKLDEPESVCE